MQLCTHDTTQTLANVQEKHGEIGKLNATQGGKHAHSGMTLDNSEKRKVKVDMRDCPQQNEVRKSHSQ